VLCNLHNTHIATEQPEGLQMFCSNDTDLNEYFKRQEEAEKRYQGARARVLNDMDSAEIDVGEILWAFKQFEQNLMTAQQVGEFIIEHCDGILDTKIEKLL
jgi:hypothetical protein